MNFMADATTGVVNLIKDVSELDIVPSEVRKIADGLRQTSQDLKKGAFLDDYHVAESDFGGSAPGSTMGVEHRLAYEVFTETLLGVVDDLLAFSQGISDAVDLQLKADERSGDYYQRLAATLPTSFASDRRTQQARDQYVPGYRTGDSDGS